MMLELVYKNDINRRFIIHANRLRIFADIQALKDFLNINYQIDNSFGFIHSFSDYLGMHIPREMNMTYMETVKQYVVHTSIPEVSDRGFLFGNLFFYY